MLDYYKKWYSANIMTLCVCSNKSIKVLENMVTSKFKQVKDKQVVMPLYDEPVPPFGPKSSKKFVQVVPVNDVD